MDVVNLIILGAGALLIISIIASIVSTRSGAPLLLVFLVIGMLAGEEGLLRIQFDNPDVALLIGTIALAIILFDGGMRTHPERFRVALAPAAVLASLGVIITCIITGLAAAYLFGLSLIEGLLLGAILSSTDAAAVFSIFQSQGARIKERVASTLEIESGSNDPMAVILTVTLITLMETGNTSLNAMVAVHVVQQAVIGAVMGYVCGRVFVFGCRKLPLSYAFYPLLAVGTSIMVYALTAKLGGSGFLAVYLMGYIVGNARMPQVMHILRVHDGLAWLCQIVMFLMLGILMTPSSILDIGFPALALAAVLILVARPLAVIIGLLPFRFPWRDQLFISWVGLRGAVPIVLALFPWMAGLENQQLYFEVAFVVVLISLVVQGWSIVPVARLLKLEVPADAGPNHRMPLDMVPGGDVLEVVAFRIEDDTPACDNHWNEITLSVPVEFVGLIRDDLWIRQKSNPLMCAGDLVLVIAKQEDIRKVSEVLAPSGQIQQGKRVSTSMFFGDFVLNADVKLEELASFYALPSDLHHDQQLRIRDVIRKRFRRRVVVGDNIRVGNLVLTVRELTDKGEILKVGIKAL